MGQGPSCLPPERAAFGDLSLLDVRKAVAAHQKRLNGVALLSARQAQQLLRPGDAAFAASVGDAFGGRFANARDRVSGVEVLGALACVAGDGLPSIPSPAAADVVGARAAALFRLVDARRRRLFFFFAAPVATRSVSLL